jgi:tape measure domain-containing protein
MRDIELRLTADLDGATKEVAGFRKEYGEMVKVVEKPLRQVNAFRELESNVEKTGRAMQDARERVRQLGAELARAETPSRKLQETYRASVRDLERLGRVEAQQVTQLNQMGAGLRAAGLDTRNLAAEQTRLSTAYNKALAAGRADTSLNSAKTALGAGAVRETQAELLRLRQQYSLVKSSGELSARDLGIAQDNYRRKVSETLARLREMRAVNAAPVKTIPVLADTARQSLGINQLKALRLQMAMLTADYQRLTRSGVLSATERAVAETQYRRKLEETRQSIAALSGEERRRSRSASAEPSSGLSDNLTIAGGGLSAIALAAAYLRTTDAAKKMEAQLKLTTSSQQEFNEAQRATFEIAQRNQAPLADVITLYSRLQPAMAQMGRGQKDTLAVIDAVTQSLRISGATASETGSTITQFSQALGSGVLRGEEFNSIAENSPRLLRALAEGLNVPTGALRNMATQGQLTADVIVDTLLGQLPKLTAEAQQLPETFGGALTQLNNQLTVSTKLFDDWAQISAKATDGVKTFTAAVAAFNSGEFGDFFRNDKKSVEGFNNEISVVMARIRDLQNVRSGLKSDSDTSLFQWKFWDRKEIDAEVSALKQHIAEMSNQRDKLAADQGQSNAEQDKLAADRLASAQKSARDLKEVQTTLVADTKTALAAQVAAEKAAASDLEKAKAAQLKTQEKYSQALSSLGAGTNGDGSYASAQSLKIGARQALQRGDVESAKQQANAALEILKKLSDAGENTYGFGGFIKELQGIEVAADGINVKKAQDSLEQAKQKTAELKAGLEELKSVVITPTMSEDAITKILKQVQDLKIKIGQQFDIPIGIAPTAEMQTVAGQAPVVKFPGVNDAKTVAAPPVEMPKSQVGPQKLTYQAGVNSYPQQGAVVPVQPVVEEDAYQKMVREVAARGKVQVPVEPMVPDGTVTDVTVAVAPQLDEAAATAAKSQIAAVAEQMRQALVLPVTIVAPNGAASASRADPDVPQFARGDMVRGPGTGTSDSILARLSNGEFVMQTAAVQHYGPQLLRQINERRLPKFATGGLVAPRMMPSIPAPAASILNQIDPPAPESMGTVALSVGGETYNLQAPQQDFQRILRNQRLKFGNS